MFSASHTKKPIRSFDTKEPLGMRFWTARENVWLMALWTPHSSRLLARLNGIYVCLHLPGAEKRCRYFTAARSFIGVPAVYRPS